MSSQFLTHHIILFRSSEEKILKPNDTIFNWPCYQDEVDTCRKQAMTLKSKGPKKLKAKQLFECENYDRKFLWRLLRQSGQNKSKIHIAKRKPLISDNPVQDIPKKVLYKIFC